MILELTQLFSSKKKWSWLLTSFKTLPLIRASRKSTQERNLTSLGRSLNSLKSQTRIQSLLRMSCLSSGFSTGSRCGWTLLQTSPSTSYAPLSLVKKILKILQDSNRSRRPQQKSRPREVSSSVDKSLLQTKPAS